MILLLPIILLLGIVPAVGFAIIINVFDRFEKEPIWLMSSAFLYGLVIAAIFSFLYNTAIPSISSMITGTSISPHMIFAVYFSPLLEELMKGVSIIIIYFYFRSEFDSVLDGIIYGSITGFGFAAFENVQYMLQGSATAISAGLILIWVSKIILTSFFHGFTTSLVGIGIAISRLSKNALKIAAPIVGFLAAVVAHFTYNSIAFSGSIYLELFSLFFEWLGLLAFLGFIIFLMFRERNLMKSELSDELDKGIITKDQYDVACSIFKNVSWEKDKKKKKFLDLCGELAFKKAEIKVESEDYKILVANLRKEVAELSKEVEF